MAEYRDAVLQAQRYQWANPTRTGDSNNRTQGTSSSSEAGTPLLGGEGPWRPFLARPIAGPAILLLAAALLLLLDGATPLLPRTWNPTPQPVVSAPGGLPEVSGPRGTGVVPEVAATGGQTQGVSGASAPGGKIRGVPPVSEVPGGAPGAPGPRPVVEAAMGAVASDEGRCSAIGRDIMKEEGGNAVDAAIATVLCAGVLNPVASGLGGGAFIFVRRANGTAEFIDGRETAPLAASQDMYTGHEADVGSGPLSVAVPGELKALHTAWVRHGSLPWRTLVAPAIKLASEGFAMSPYLAQFAQMASAVILKDPGLRSVFAPKGEILKEGELCVRAQLGATLRRIAEEGPDVVYRGEVGAALVRELRAAGGVVSEEDLAAYKADVMPAVEAHVFGLTALTVQPPSGGGVSVIEVLKILEGFKLPLAALGPLGVHRMVEAMKHTSALRMELGDPRFVDTAATVRDMLSSEFAAKLRRAIADNTTFPPSHYGRPAADGKPHPLFQSLDDHGTSHTCVVDKDRNAVGITSTVNGAWGAGILSLSTGILYNNEMADFALPSNNRSSFAPPPAPTNFIRPGKRPLSSMAPFVLLQKGKLRAVVGGSGGPFIVSAVLQVILNYFVKGMSPLEAVRAPRVHHQLLPDLLFYEVNHTAIHGPPIGFDSDTVAALQRRGHQMFPLAYGGVAQLIVQDLEEPVDAGYTGRDAGYISQEGARRVLRGGRLQEEEGKGEALKDGGSRRGGNSVVGESGFEVYRGKLTAVSDPRKDGVPAGY